VQKIDLNQMLLVFVHVNGFQTIIDDQYLIMIVMILLI